jgi:two-component system cell cycle sensor histidine kinase/response regulator CckA
VVSVGPLIRDTTRFALSGSNVKPRFSIEDDLWNIEADEGQIGQVLQNLIINARESTPQGGELSITAGNAMYELNGRKVPSKVVMIRIQDHGIGIPPNYMKKIFDPYFSTKQNGRGLGLTIVFSIIEKHGGHIEVDSHVGEGTTFTIYLPALTVQVPSKPEIQAVSKESHGTVLWMDDEREVLEVVSEFLSINGYDSMTAEDGEAAIQMFLAARDSGKNVVAVILDLTVPGGMGGKDTIQALRKIDPSIRAIVCSGYYSDPVMANFGLYGFNAVLQKPFSIEELNQVLALTLNRSGDG